MSTAVVLATAMLFLAMGLYGLVAPARLIRPFGIALPVAQARAEVRAVYGGFGVAVAAVLATASPDPTGTGAGPVTTVAAALLGMAAGRLISRATEAPDSFYPVWFYFWVELTGAAALLATVCGADPTSTMRLSGYRPEASTGRHRHRTRTVGLELRRGHLTGAAHPDRHDHTHDDHHRANPNGARSEATQPARNPQSPQSWRPQARRNSFVKPPYEDRHCSPVEGLMPSSRPHRT